MKTKNLSLVPHDPAHLRALLEGPRFYESASGFRIAEGLGDFVRYASGEWLERLLIAVEPDPWTWGCAVVEPRENMVIGAASFKGAPGTERMVEIAYGIAEAYQGRGYATEAAMGLIQFARESGLVSVVRAHTLPTNWASIRVLEKCGFKRIGEVIEPEDGLVVRWELFVIEEKPTPPTDSSALPS